MKAQEWLNIIKQTADYNPAMTTLIEKYGEMLVEEYKEENPPCNCDQDEDDDSNSSYVEPLQLPFLPSQELADIIGTNQKLMRMDAVKRLWATSKKINFKTKKKKDISTLMRK